MAKILIVDDDPLMLKTLHDMAGHVGHEAVTVATLGGALQEISIHDYDVVLLDVNLPDGNGLAAIDRIHAAASRPEVIIITGMGDPEGAGLAIKSGAWDYIEKTASLKTIALCLVRAAQYREAKTEKKFPVIFKDEGIIGSSSRMMACRERLVQAAASEANVLITGETGTGKELFARAIHSNSARVAGNFVTVDCSALPPTIVESILFGHAKGAFTSADRAQEGLIGQANGGTLFLDEVGEIPFHVQRAFLRVLQERRYRPVGSKKELESNFRLVSATNRDLDAMVTSGEFRDDLLFRLKALTLEAPPLREHPEDIKELAFHYVSRFCERYDTVLKGFSPEFLEALVSYDWPGNVREMIQTLERAVTVARHEPTLYPQHLPTEIRVKLVRASMKQSGSRDGGHLPLDATREFPTFHEVRRMSEREYLLGLLDRSGNAMKEACRISGLSRSYLYSLLKEHGITKPKK